MDLVFGIDNGDRFQDGLERTEHFSWPLRNVDHKGSTPESPVDQASLFD